MLKTDKMKKRLSFEAKIYMTLLFICGLATVVKFIFQAMTAYPN